MKTTVTTKQTKEKTYPWVGVDKRDGHVVLFISEDWGVTLVGYESAEVDEKTTYYEDFYTPCTITLSSEE